MVSHRANNVSIAYLGAVKRDVRMHAHSHTRTDRVFGEQLLTEVRPHALVVVDAVVAELIDVQLDPVAVAARVSDDTCRRHMPIHVHHSSLQRRSAPKLKATCISLNVDLCYRRFC